ncbi:MAG: peroxiredoxin family protein, partial [Candidatus Promineifilaceae bacterium]
MIDFDPGQPRRWNRRTLLIGGLVVAAATAAVGLVWALRPTPAAPQTAVAELATSALATTNPLAPFPVPATVPALAPGDGNAGQRGVAAGQPAPDFSLPALDGALVSLTAYQGRPLLINFWASWCPPCRLEMPDLVRAYEAHKDEGFVI